MDYSPTPGKVKPQYAFLDDSIEIGRSEVSKPFKSSPLKNQYQFQNQNEKDTETFHQKQKQFYNKYRDLTSAGDSPDLLKEKQKARSTHQQQQQTSSDTTSRLFKNIGTKIPVDDVVKINSNMIEKIIRENESLKNSLKEERKENHILNGFANGLKDKLVKYKKLNDDLKLKNEDLSQDKKDLEQKLIELETKQRETEVELLESKKSQAAKVQITSPPESPKYNFDPENVQDIFNGVNDNENNDNNANNESPELQTANTKIEERIQTLEIEVSKINTNQDSKFDYIKNEIEFLKNLSLQVQTKKSDEPEEVPKDTEERSPREDDLIVKESLELKELQEQVDIVTKKLQLREQNKIKKFELNKELEKLALQLKHDDVPQFQTQQPIPQVHTPENQKSSAPSSTKIHTPQQQQRAPASNQPLDNIRERLRSKDCNTCCDKTSDKDETPKKAESKHIPSFKIGDTVWN